MPSSMKQFIIRKLKENVPLAEIKRDLREKGYAIEEINRAVREAISQVDKKFQIKSPVHFVILGFVAVIVVLWLVVMSPFSESLCGKFKDTSYAISCDEAVALALADSPGTVEEVSIGIVQLLDPSNITPDVPIVYDERDAWLVDIRIASPYFHEVLEQEIKFLRVGIDINNGEIYKRPLE